MLLFKQPGLHGVLAGEADGHVNLGARDGGGGGESECEENGGDNFFHGDGCSSLNSRAYMGCSQGKQTGMSISALATGAAAVRASAKRTAAITFFMVMDTPL